MVSKYEELEFNSVFVSSEYKHLLNLLVHTR